MREYRLTQRFTFRLRDAAGKELIAPSQLVLTRDLTYNEANTLAKDYEEQQLYRDMQRDIVQQFLIAGFGGLFPLFGWTPSFAVGHEPRFPIKPPTPRPAAAPTDGGPGSAQRRSAAESAAGTIKPARTRGRTSRRGRRR